MKSFLPIMLLLFALAPTAAQTAPDAVSAYPIAGIHPDQRPDGAPIVRDAPRTRDWEERVFHGIAKPVPSNLGAADLGAWYTPFNHPGMSGPYDLRQWHQVVGCQNRMEGMAPGASGFEGAGTADCSSRGAKSGSRMQR